MQDKRTGQSTPLPTVTRGFVDDSMLVDGRVTKQPWSLFST